MKTGNKIKIKRVTIISNALYCLTALFFLLDFFTGFDIRNQILKSIIYRGFLIGIPIMFFWNLSSRRIVLILYPVLFLLLIIIVNPVTILYQETAWETYTVRYKHKYKEYKFIEFQMQDIGALGYNRREVEVTYLTPLFMITKEVPPNIDLNTEWTEDGSPGVMQSKFRYP